MQLQQVAVTQDQAVQPLSMERIAAALEKEFRWFDLTVVSDPRFIFTNKPSHVEIKPADKARGGFVVRYRKKLFTDEDFIFKADPFLGQMILDIQEGSGKYVCTKNVFSRVNVLWPKSKALPFAQKVALEVQGRQSDWASQIYPKALEFLSSLDFSFFQGGSDAASVCVALEVEYLKDHQGLNHALQILMQSRSLIDEAGVIGDTDLFVYDLAQRRNFKEIIALTAFLLGFNPESAPIPNIDAKSLGGRVEPKTNGEVFTDGTDGIKRNIGSSRTNPKADRARSRVRARGGAADLSRFLGAQPAAVETFTTVGERASKPRMAQPSPARNEQGNGKVRANPKRASSKSK